MSENRRILVTSALPYANGHIHVGHLVEYIQTDIWVRYQRMRGRDVAYMCADDTHGTPIMLRARQEGRSEKELIAEMSQAHQTDFAHFSVSFDHYGSTNSAANQKLCHELWGKLGEAKMIVRRSVEQLYDPEAGLFLADRFVRGTCPRCNTPGQHGDACESCGATYSPIELKDAQSTVSGAKPEIRSAEHLFVNIESKHAFLEEWATSGDHLQPSIANYLKGHFLSAPLQDWDVSRPAPYFGFEIPDAPGNYWYVWFDAPIGYMASTWEWCQKNGRNFDDYWRSEDTEIIHFIGKDITYFHALFWPAMLHAGGFTLPRRVQVHGFLTVNGEKMSKSKGTMISAATFAEHLDPEQLRYYYASRLTSKVDDLDLDLEDFTARVNSDLVGKVVNLASRSARFLQKTGLSAKYPEDDGLFAEGAAAGEEILEAYEGFEFGRAMRRIMRLADRANEYVDRMQPWKIAKDPSRAAELQDTCTVALNAFRQIAIYLAPVLPGLAKRTEELFDKPIGSFDEAAVPTVGSAIRPFKHLMARVDPKKVQAVLAASKETAAPSPAAPPQAAPSKSEAPAEPLAERCTFEDFSKVDLRVAQVLDARPVDGSKKLVELRVDLGWEQRTIFAGIRSAYADPKALVGRLIVVVANLAPRKMKCGVSEGMAIAAGPGGADIFLLSPDSGAKVGQRVH